MNITIKQNAPVISSDGRRVLGYFRQSLALECPSFTWSWHGHTIEPPKMIEAGDGHKEPENRMTIALDYDRAGIQVWRVVSERGEVEIAFDSHMFSRGPVDEEEKLAEAVKVVLTSELSRTFGPDTVARLEYFVKCIERKTERRRA